MRYPFPRSSRIRKGKHFDIAFRTGKRIRGELTTLLVTPSPDGTVKVGLAVGKRMGNAAVRNRGKRILREAIRHILPQVAKDVWLILSLRTAGLKSRSGDVRHDLFAVLSGEGLIRGEEKND